MDGTPVALGDWVEVFCSWTHEPKFDGRPVQIIAVLRGGKGVVFQLRDPFVEAPHFFLIADGHGYRRVTSPLTMN